MKLVVATHNAHKLGEIKTMLQGLPYEVISLDAFPDLPEVIEDGKTFEENAKKKAVDVCSRTGHWVLADDSGICVDALGGEPGVLSARFSGEAKDDLQNNLKVLKLLSNLPQDRRKAHFYCAIALARPGQARVVSGRVDGFISEDIKGKNGFGYDSVFFYPPFHCNFGEVDPEMKNQVSHRAKALEEAKKVLEQWVQKG